MLHVYSYSDKVDLEFSFWKLVDVLAQSLLVHRFLGPRLLVLIILVFGFLVLRRLVFNLMVLSTLVFVILFSSHALSVGGHQLSVVLVMSHACLEGILCCLRYFIHSQGLAYKLQLPPLYFSLIYLH